MACFVQFWTHILWSHSNCLPPSSPRLVLSLVSSQNQRKFPLTLSAITCTQKKAAKCKILLNKCCYPYRYQAIKIAHGQILCLGQSCLLFTKRLYPSPFWRPGADPHHASALLVLVPLFEGRCWGHHWHTLSPPSLLEQYFSILAKRITRSSLCHASRKSSKTFSQLTEQLSYCTSSDLGTERGNGKKLNYKQKMYISLSQFPLFYLQSSFFLSSLPLYSHAFVWRCSLLFQGWTQMDQQISVLSSLMMGTIPVCLPLQLQTHLHKHF